jgi:hypothetical protein
LECKSGSLSIEVYIRKTRHSFILHELRRKSFNEYLNKKITAMSSEYITKYAFSVKSNIIITVTTVTALYFIIQRKKKLDVKHSSESFINGRNGSWYVYMNIYIYIHIHIYVYIYVYIYIYINIYEYVYILIDIDLYECLCIYVKLCICIYTYTLHVYICNCVYLYVHTHYMCIYIDINMHVYICVCIYIFKCIHTGLICLVKVKKMMDIQKGQI